MDKIEAFHFHVFLFSFLNNFTLFVQSVNII